MLVLQRRVNEAIYLDWNGQQVTVILVEAHGGAARIGFDAPLDVKITRDDAVNKAPRQRTEKSHEAAE